MTQSDLHQKINGRDAAHRLLARLTTGTVLGALAGVGVFGYVSAATIPGKPSNTAASTATTATSSSTDESTSSTDDTSSSSGLSTSSGSVSSTAGTSTPIAVTGGSR